jgi:parallel beta-helix repeat protein
VQPADGAGPAPPRRGRGFGRPVAAAARRGGLIAALATVLGTWAGAGAAGAGSCGAGVACQCGDTVTEDYQLVQDLGPCSGHGLLVKSNVTLDCRGSRITGPGDASGQVGILLNGRPGAEVAGATVKNCHVSGFRRGIRLRSASGNVIAGNTAVGNGDRVKHVGYGIDVSAGSANNLFEGNRVQGNADEGIHIGPGSHKNRLVANVLSDNHRENLYVLSADGGVFVRNTFGGGGINSLYLKDASGNRFEGNTFVGRTARVVGHARDNEFVNNTFSGTGLHFTAYKGDPRRAPGGNRVTGGSIAAPAECVRFTASGGNVIADVSLARCGTAVRAESPSGPTSNTVVGEMPDRVQLDGASTLNLARPLTVQVQEPTGAPVPAAQVEARDAAGRAAFTVATDETGSIPAQVAIAAARTGAGTAARSPLTLTVTKPGYRTETRPVPPTGPASLVITLEPQR